MTFNNISFLLLFLPIFTILYYITPSKFRNHILIIGSLLFYGFGNIYTTICLFMLTIFNYYFSKLGINKRNFIIITIIDIIALILFKIFDKFSIGFIFILLQIISYNVDIYIKKDQRKIDIITYLTYILMFPKLFTVLNFTEIEEQLKNRKFKIDNYCLGFTTFIKGLMKKALIANPLLYLFTIILNLPSYESTLLTSWLGLIAITLGMFYEFTSFMDMTIGLSKMYGFDIPKNFNKPYLKKSISEFIESWFITINNWFKYNIFIYTKKISENKIFQIFNTLVIYVLMTLIFGFKWNFVLLGLYIGTFLILEKYILNKFKIPSKIKRLYTIIFIMFYCLIFICDLNTLEIYLKGLFNFNRIIDKTFIYYLYNYIF